MPALLAVVALGSRKPGHGKAVR